uniref:Nucleolar protein 56 n=1 Tax=Cryptomonas curvata TaxID=233186 RepID=A0A7S0NB16_9CRYP|mmetsp:Transcript_967/g.2080  ORF Transcript_967/g.2080 Transcript_967/m.2080 type:complete len:491 (+) Transcript_967:79-1551(+)
MSLFVLFESASGYALFEQTESDEIGELLEEMQNAMADLSRFSKVIKLKAFVPFKAAEEALEAANDISEGILNEGLRSFLEMNLPAAKKDKKPKFTLGVIDSKIGNSISEEMGIPCSTKDPVPELIRGIRLHFARYVKGLEDGDLCRAQLGLAHSYSRSKVKFNVNRQDNMIIQSISLLDTLDKDINTFSMRVKEWYGWHFPELVRIVADNYKYSRMVQAIAVRTALTDESVDMLQEILDDDEGLAKQVIEASKISMGYDMSDVDMINVQTFALRVIQLEEYRRRLREYLNARMHSVAPNLSSLIGEIVGARLISHAGSLTNLAKYPASTVQILGAEKALFRALKTKGNTPKYGLIFHSTFIGRAAQKNKGRISRYLANKCSICSRIDCFSETPSTIFGEKMKEQVEERLKFYDSGVAPRKNIDVMREAIGQLGADTADDKKKKKKKKAAEPEAEAEAEAPKKKKAKKAEPAEEEEEEPEEKPKKKKDKAK